MTTRPANKAQGEVALAKLKEMFSPFSTDMEMRFSEFWEDEEGNPYCEIEWLTGPFDWAYINPRDGGRASGTEFPPVKDWPPEMWTEARDAYTVRVWVEV